MYVFKIWRERLYRVERNFVQKCTAKQRLIFEPITEHNAKEVIKLRGKEYLSQFHEQLREGDFGYFAYLDGNAVGYGWIKGKGAKDYFFDIKNDVKYLCRFFVHEDFRGQGIYPEIICALIEKAKENQVFYIAVEKGNQSSERGLKKVGFELVEEIKFVRILKRTINKKSL